MCETRAIRSSIVSARVGDWLEAKNEARYFIKPTTGESLSATTLAAMADN
jgi:hypothetical protein